MGYNNYSVQEQMLLCQIVEKIVPLGRNMWEQVALHYNANRNRTSPERDFESLRRKFKSLYGKPKPTGKGEVPLRLRPVVWAKRIQMKIESEGGVQTSHDGLDGGEDDAALEDAVRVATAQEGDESDSDGESEGPVNADRDEAEQEDVVSEGTPAAGTEQEGDAISQYAQRSSPPPTPQTQATGSIVTGDGTIDVSLVHLFNLSGDSSSDVEDDTNANSTAAPPSSAQGTPSQPGAALTAPTGTASATPQHDRVLRGETTPSAGSEQPRRTASSAGAALPRSTGRPRSTRRGPNPTMASPDGPMLQRDPSRAAEDDREVDENRNLNVASNRLGGHDLRVLRDNVATLTENLVNANGKRASTGTDATSTDPSYAQNKRVRAKKRLDEIQREIDDLEKRQSSSGGDLMGMLLLLQKDSDRRLQSEERRRREDREERIEAEKRERAEREQTRREEAEAETRRRQDAAEATLQLREDMRREDAVRQAALDSEREENKRRYEERLAFNREEARQRHEQMMMLLSSLQKK
ncbi:hypothetical protein PF010_g25941 [Phytophthora fragariae]|nr:hypothetical protein PF003_g40154 [Phytophthora fragariae]KAE9071254.1 hypothetical protein PF010_g25941 [Phytophthora fragariae]KAE9087559.1 hypothetical protein PF006_g25776 [Phytophthora fragariae]KAE9277250.1 hypothetical protein PF001_g25743 [Phytophthora fragariae]